MIATVTALTAGLGGFLASGIEGSLQFGTQAWLIVSVLQLTRDVAELKGKKGGKG